MKKKLAALMLCVMMAGTMTACGSQVSNENITIKQYKGLEVAKVEEPEAVSDQYVENTMQSYLGASLETEGTAKDGDTVNIDYVGKIDGKAFEGGTAKQQKLTIGSGLYIGANGEYKGFEEQVIGHKAGETFDIEVKFPADYHQKDYANKVAVFTITLNGMYPEMTDEWVQKVSKESKTVDEFRAEIRKNIEDYNKEQVKGQLRVEVLEALTAQIEVKELPKEEIEKEMKEIREYYEKAAEQYGVTFEEFLKEFMGMDEKTFETKSKEAAEAGVTRKIACKLLAKKHHLEPKKEEIEKKTEEFAKQSGYDDIEAFKKDFGEDVIMDTILQQKVADYLVEKCVQVEESKSETDAATEGAADAEDTAKTDDKKADDKKADKEAK